MMLFIPDVVGWDLPFISYICLVLSISMASSLSLADGLVQDVRTPHVDDNFLISKHGQGEAPLLMIVV